MESRLEREFLTMCRMVEIHCGDRHGHGADSVCKECEQFLAYVHRRLEKCPYGEAKPTCARCPIHCYKARERETAREVMKYAGPRMPLRHPWLAILHVADKLRRVEHPMERRRRQRG
ncbi:MAG: nitrous oxide-stimulated promoter family protein [Steroidobacteraceae bacterium]